MAWLLACTSLSLAPEEGEGVTLLFCSGELFTPLCCGVNGCVCCRGMWNPSRSLDRSRVVSTPVGPGSTLQALQLAPERTKDWNLLFFTLEPAGVKQRPRLQWCCPCRFLCTLGLSSPNRDLLPWSFLAIPRIVSWENRAWGNGVTFNVSKQLNPQDLLWLLPHTRHGRLCQSRAKSIVGWWAQSFPRQSFWAFPPPMLRCAYSVYTCIPVCRKGSQKQLYSDKRTWGASLDFLYSSTWPNATRSAQEQAKALLVCLEMHFYECSLYRSFLALFTSCKRWCLILFFFIYIVKDHIWWFLYISTRLLRGRGEDGKLIWRLYEFKKEKKAAGFAENLLMVYNK